MKLTLEQIHTITKGVVNVTEEAGLIRLYRFTEAQSQAYFDRGNMDFYKKTYASAGVRFAFVSNTEHLSFSFEPHMASSRKWFSLDVRVNDRIVAHKEYRRDEDPENFRFEATFGAGEKRIEVYLPFSARMDFKEIAIDDGATLKPLHRTHTMIEFGDSITHGYDGHFPSLSYANRLAFLLDADSVNKGIGGDTFFPELIAAGGDLYETPDYITVAYGTNDWVLFSPDELRQNCRAFYKALSEKYPNAKIFAITPLWRGDFKDRPSGKFGAPLREMDALIGDSVADLGNVTLILGEQLVPHEPEFFAEDFLHPSDLGFCQYSQNLFDEIKKHI
ncbi:MAG: SGNH/GDSL hydrolase family protein [Clostridia bacterium]|nr:SGNH/GDSL hydrolase family protein [Clostridia bacterium]